MTKDSRKKEIPLRPRKHWIFVLNNYTDEDINYIKIIICNMENVRYLTYGREIGDEGTPHLQGYCQFFKTTRLAWWKKHMQRAHVQNARGSLAENQEYCHKDGIIFEHGAGTTQGTRVDLDNIRTEIESGNSSLRIAEDHFPQWCQYGRRFDVYRSLLQIVQGSDVPRNYPCRGVVYWGPTGTGKSTKAFSENIGAYVLTKPASSSIWFDGYCGQSTVILDDFDGWLPFRFLLTLLDAFPRRVEFRNGSCEFRASKIIITSNSPPCEWYPLEDYAPLRRRLNEIKLFPL